MKIEILKIDSLARAKAEMEKIKAGGIELMGPRAVHKVVKLYQVEAKTANLLKQQMLKSGGDAAISYDAWSDKPVRTDMIIFGTLEQYEKFIAAIQKKGLKGVAEDIQRILNP